MWQQRKVLQLPQEREKAKEQADWTSAARRRLLDVDGIVLRNAALGKKALGAAAALEPWNREPRGEKRY